MWSCFILFLSLFFLCKNIHKGISIAVSIVSCAPIWPPANHFLKGLAFPRMAKVVFRKVWHFRGWRKSFPERFGISAAGGSHFPNGLAFPRSAKVISRMVWHFRGWRKSFPEGFGISALGESHFPKGLAFPRSAKVISRKVWHFRAWRKLFPEWFGVPAHGESRFPNGLELVVAKIWKLTIQRNGHVRLLGHYYSVPHTYVGKKESMKKRKNMKE